MLNCTPWTIKTCHFVFDYNSGITCSIFIIFILVERGRNNLQFTYLMAWWRHNSVIMHVTKVYFIQLVRTIKYVEFEDNPKKFYKKTWECESFSATRLTKELPIKKIGKYEHWTTFCKSCELANNRFDRMHCHHHHHHIRLIKSWHAQLSTMVRKICRPK